MSHIKVTEIKDQKTWETFISSQNQANFLSSWYWGVFHKELDKHVRYRGYYEKEKLVGVCLLVCEQAKRGTYATVAGGPILDWDNQNVITAWRDDVRQQGKQLKANFIRVRPQILNTQENNRMFSRLGFKQSPMHLTADLTLQLDLSLTEDELLAQMRKNTRYEIRKASKLGLIVKTTTDKSQIDSFYEHQLELAKKHGFIPFSLDFLKKQFIAFNQADAVKLIHAFDKDTLLASAFVIMYGQEAVYHYGISTDANRKKPGSYAVQWEAIKQAKELGLKRYNFWGIAPKEDTDHRFAGVSLFKRGFGGEEVEYLPAHDLSLSWKYPLINAFETFRAKKRNLS